MGTILNKLKIKQLKSNGFDKMYNSTDLGQSSADTNVRILVPFFQKVHACVRVHVTFLKYFAYEFMLSKHE